MSRQPENVLQTVLRLGKAGLLAMLFAVAFAVSWWQMHPEYHWTRWLLFLALVGWGAVLWRRHRPAGIAPRVRAVDRLIGWLDPAEPVPAVAERTALYRWFDADGRLLYVGITNNLGARTSEHAERRLWMQHAVRSSVEHFPSRELALAAETRAIHDERPVHNIAQNGRRRPWYA